jgi:hypothetical protein
MDRSEKASACAKASVDKKVKSEKAPHRTVMVFRCLNRKDSPSLSWVPELRIFLPPRSKSFRDMAGFMKLFTVHFSLLPFALCLFTLFTLSSCSDSFEPFGENDRFFFTIYGFLDASADTQWVRISPVRGDFEQPAQLPDMLVTLEHLDSGTSAVMNDSLVSFRQGFNAINAWTDLDIEPDQTYRLRAENDSGDVSEVTVSLPPDFPTPRLFIESIPGEDPRYFLFFGGVERLADIQSRWYLRLYTSSWEDKRLIVRSLKTQAFREPSGLYVLEMFPDEQLEEIKRELLVQEDSALQVEVLRHQVFVASGGPEWDEEITGIDDLVYNLPDGFSNIENGLGYFVGIVGKLFPFESCRDENNNLVGCPLERPYW